jgi:hypothetical protein
MNPMRFIRWGVVILFCGAVGGWAAAAQPGNPPPVVADRCGRCHATEIDGRCLAGDCRAQGVPVIRTGPRDWSLATDFMVSALGCPLTPGERKTVTEWLDAAFPGPQYPLTWTEVFSVPATRGWNVVTLTSWREHLYFGTEGGGGIFRSRDGLAWDEVASTGHDKVYGFTAFRDALFAGAYNPRPEIWSSADGRAWARVATLPPLQRGVTALGTFRDRLYVGTGSGRVYRSEDGRAWDQGVALVPGSRDTWGHWIRFLVEFRGRLYAGLEGGGLFRSRDGSVWSPVPVPLSGRPGLRGAAVFGGRLYIGSTGTGEILRTQDGERWETVFKGPAGRGYVAAMAVFDGALYASFDGTVLRSRDGRSWEPVGEISPKTVEALAPFGGELYAGTDRPPGGQLFRTTGLEPSTKAVPVRETALAGTVTGSYLDVQTGYQIPEVIEEALADGTRALDHRWTIPHPGGRRLLVAIRGHRSAGGDGEAFAFSVSTDGEQFRDLFVLGETEETRGYHLIPLPSLPPGEVTIRVQDTDRAPGRTARAWVSMDHVYLLVEGTPPNRP